MNWTASITEADPFSNYDNSTENDHSIIFVKSAGLGLLVALTIGGKIILFVDAPECPRIV
jgi:hypothetical protein